MTTGAIQADAPGAANTQAPVDLNDPSTRLSRDEAMKRMTARRLETVAQDMDPADRAAYFDGAAPSGAPDPDLDATDAAAEAERARLAAGETPSNVDTDPARQLATQRGEETILSDDDLARVKVRRKVNGVEEIVPVGDVLRSAQKVDAAEDFLRKAKETLAEVNTVAAAARAAPAAPAQADSTTDQAGGDTSPGGDPIDEYVNAMFQGDEERAKSALRRAVGRPSATPIDQETVISQVEQRIVVRNALKKFAQDHQEIASDPIARGLADNFLGMELRERGVARLEDLDPDGIQAAIDAAGTRTKNYFREKAGMPAAAMRPANGGDRLARKQAAPTELPAAATRAASSAPQPRTSSDVIAEMRRARAPQVGQGAT